MAIEAKTPKIEIVDVHKQFAVPGGERQVVDGVSFEVNRGEFVAVIGPSGCGKSTLFNIMAGLEEPTSGELKVDGADAIGVRENVAYMPQKDLLFPWRTIAENCALGLEVQGVWKLEARKRARDLFATFGLSGFEDSHPFELSGGMRQRAALLRTVVQGRDILLLDEPFGALDSLTRIEMQNWLQGVWAKHEWTAVMITHDIREAIYLADRVIVLSARPTSVRLNVEIDLPRPRELSVITSPEFAAIEEQLIETLHEESRKALELQGTLL
ncbi:ABC transporter ATP-binding protein [Demequina salsinemoris]|uniref:ABC transporter ATP-binding protein n=1 Tax=Demequina salsinemoris TaxID=577470 RepID=UPI000A011F9F|nr:ABC transporter ATP-binding protein [Demequina salsinemoris]